MDLALGEKRKKLKSNLKLAFLKRYKRKIDFMTIVLHPTYFPSIAQCVAIAHADSLRFEVWDNYQKQTYRNRAHIYSAQGKLALTVPVIYTQTNRQLYKDIQIFNESNWQDLHWKSIQTSYNGSPFFEYYEDDLKHLFEKQYDNLMAFNLDCFSAVLECLQLDIPIQYTDSFEKNLAEGIDYRPLVDNRKEIAQNFNTYVQVFDDKHGFMDNLSILDLIFNEGPNAMLYLESQKITL